MLIFSMFFTSSCSLAVVWMLIGVSPNAPRIEGSVARVTLLGGVGAVKRWGLGQMLRSVGMCVLLKDSSHVMSKFS